MGTNGTTQEDNAGCRIQQLDLDRREKKMATQQKKINADIALVEKERTKNNTSHIEKIDCLSSALSESTRKHLECESAIKDLHEQMENSAYQSQSDAKTLQIDMDSQVGNLKERLVIVKNALSESNSQHKEIYQEMEKKTEGTVAPMASEIQNLKMQLQKYEKEVYKLTKKNEASVQCNSNLKTKTAYANTVQIDNMSRDLKTKHQEEIDKLVKTHDSVVKDHLDSTNKSVYANTANIDKLSQDLKNKHQEELKKLLKQHEALVKDHFDSNKKSVCANSANIERMSNDMKIKYENDARKERLRTQSIIAQHQDKLCKCQTESERLVGKIRQYESNSNEWEGRDTELERICGMIVSSIPDNVKTQTIDIQQKFVTDVLQSMGHM